ncbi:MAG: M28 family peptidase [Bacteroidales bacterium]|nr:M28 family peptidase [Bacteroidales bacterium]
MKKLLFSLIAVLISSVMMAGSFVKINYSGRAELEKLFADDNLTVHYYNDMEVYATANAFDCNAMTLLDENAFAQNEVYTLLYCPQNHQNAYLAKHQLQALNRTDHTVLVRGMAMPYKNDGAVAIFNRPAQLPQLTRDFPVVTEMDPRISEMLAQVDMDSLQATVQHLQDYGSRIWNSDNAFAASDWIAGRMASYGLEVEQQAFNANTWMGSGAAGPNVIGIQRGTLYPDTYVVCGSHLDSFSYEAWFGSGTAPGADDNATGVASVLESARIMSQYEFEYSIVYCAYGCEEMGLYGSEAYASRCQQEGMDIIGYFNNDMNGYLYGDQIHIDLIYPNSVEPIGNYYMNVANVYYPEMPVRHVNFSEGDSDHTSFNNHGYMGIYPFEDYQHYSPNIHTPQDLIGPSVNSFGMSQRYCQMNIACLSEIANPIGEMPVVQCNPVNGFVINEPIFKDLSFVVLEWQAPEPGSTGDLVRFDIYRDDQLHATVDNDVYSYMDTITENADAEYYIMAVYSDNCEAASETLIGHGNPTQVTESGRIDVQLYPNPVEGDLTVKAEGLQHVVVYNAMGQQVAVIMPKQDECLIPMAYPQGMYFIQVVTANGMITKNVVVR